VEEQIYTHTKQDKIRKYSIRKPRKFLEEFVSGF
jgi:hypothetical protein